MKNIKLAFDQDIRNNEYFIEVDLSVQFEFINEEGQSLYHPYIPDDIVALEYEINSVDVYKYGLRDVDKIAKGNEYLLKLIDVELEDEINCYIQTNFNKLKEELTNNIY